MLYRNAIALAMLLLAANAAQSSLIIDASNAVFSSDAITGISAGDFNVTLSIGDAVPADLYDPADYPLQTDLHSLSNQLGLALVDELNTRGISPGFFDGCEINSCAIFIPSSYNPDREFVSLSNPLWTLDTGRWVADAGDLQADSTAAFRGGITLTQLSTQSVPLPATVALLGFGLLSLKLRRN